jgi:hypothetical protein
MTIKTPNLDRVQRWDTNGDWDRLSAREDGSLAYIDDVRAAYAKDLADVARTSRRDAFGEVVAKIREVLAAEEGPRKTDSERGAIQAYLLVESWAQHKRYAVPSQPSDPKPTR